MSDLWWGGDGQGWGNGCIDYVSDGFWTDAGACVNEATCHPDSWSYSFLDSASDKAFAPIGYGAWGATHLEHGVNVAQDWFADWSDPETWDPPSGLYAQPQWRWHDVEVI